MFEEVAARRAGVVLAKLYVSGALVVGGFVGGCLGIVGSASAGKWTSFDLGLLLLGSVLVAFGFTGFAVVNRRREIQAGIRDKGGRGRQVVIAPTLGSSDHAHLAPTLARRLVFGVSVALIGGLGTVVAVAGLVSLTGDTSVEFDVGVPFGAFVAIVSVWRTLRVSIQARTDGISVRNVLRSYDLAWTELSEVSSTADQLVLGRKEGRAIKVSASATGLIGGSADVLQELDSLVHVIANCGVSVIMDARLLRETVERGCSDEVAP